MKNYIKFWSENLKGVDDFKYLEDNIKMDLGEIWCEVVD
jgi:hypothetical protein